MAALDDILGTGASGMKQKPIMVAPPPVDSQLQGAKTTVGSQPFVPQATATAETQPSATATGTQPKETTSSRSVSQRSTEQRQGYSISPRPGINGQDVVSGNPTHMSYVEMYEAMNPDKPETPEERTKREKREKSEAILAAVGDGISALSNLFFTTKYAPNSYDPSQGMTAKARERWARLKAEREANRRAYNDGYLRALAMDKAEGRESRMWNHTIERERISDERQEKADVRAQAKADRDTAMAELRMELMQGRINEQEAAAAAKKIESDYAEAYWQSRINKNNRPTIGGSRSRPGEYPWYDRNGGIHYAHSYEAMRQNAIDAGTWNETSQKSTSERIATDRHGKPKGKTSTMTEKPAKGHSSKPKTNKYENTAKIKW